LVDVEPWEIALADNLLRLELTLGARFWRLRREAKEKHWSLITEPEIDTMHLECFGQFVAESEQLRQGALQTRGDSTQVHRCPPRGASIGSAPPIPRLKPPRYTDL
jgi:hypothetical protein